MNFSLYVILEAALLLLAVAAVAAAFRWASRGGGESEK